jgi:hypothetical protein
MKSHREPTPHGLLETLQHSFPDINDAVLISFAASYALRQAQHPLLLAAADYISWSAPCVGATCLRPPQENGCARMCPSGDALPNAVPYSRACAQTLNVHVVSNLCLASELVQVQFASCS